MLHPAYKKKVSTHPLRWRPMPEREGRGGGLSPGEIVTGRAGTCWERFRARHFDVFEVRYRAALPYGGSPHLHMQVTESAGLPKPRR